MTVKDIFDYINSFAPFDTQAEWDNAGILAGSPDASVTKAVVALDVTSYEAALAARENAELIISHHPLIFRPIKKLPVSDIAYITAANHLNVISAHTNFDKAHGGVNDLLCAAVGFDYEKISDKTADGFLNVCHCPTGLTAREFAEILSKKLSASVRFSDALRKVTKIAVCSGSGAEFLDDAAALGCDAFLTGDASYHDFLNATDMGISLFAAGHFETENLAAAALAKRLSEKFPEIKFIVSDRQPPVVTVC